MSGQAAYSKVVNIVSDAIAHRSSSLNRGAAALDDTDIAEAASTGFRSHLSGIKDWSVSISGAYDHTDTAQAALEAAWLAVPATVFAVHYLPDGTNGFTGNVIVQDFNVEGDVEGLENYTCTLISDGALAAE